MSIVFSPSAVLTIDTTQEFLQGGGAAPPVPPWVQPGAIIDLDFANDQYYWNGTTSLSTALIVNRPDVQLAMAQNADGSWSTFGPNVARVGRGLLVEGTSTNRLLYSRDFSNAVWTVTNATLGIAAASVLPVIPKTLVQVPTGTTSWPVPEGITSLLGIYLQGPGGNGANGNGANSGGGGGSGAFIYSAGLSIGIASALTVAVPPGGSEQETLIKNGSGTTIASARPGGNAVGTTAGAPGAQGLSLGQIKSSGANGGAGFAGVGGGGGGGGSPYISIVGAATGAQGKSGAAGNATGGGGGGAVGSGTTSATTASGAAGGVGGKNPSGTGAGAGGTTTTVAGTGIAGAGGGGGLSAVGANGGTNTAIDWVITQGAFTDTVSGCAGGGGGGGATGNGAAAAPGGGGGGGGSSGTGGAGGDGLMYIVYGSQTSTRVTATSANATITNTLTLPPYELIHTPSILMKPITVTGPVYLSIDGGTSKTDISSQLIAGQYEQVVGYYQSTANPVFYLEIANSGDVIDIDFAQVERFAYASSPIPTGTVTATRLKDDILLNVAAYLDWMISDALTVLTTIWPKSHNFSTTGDEYQGGFNALDINGSSGAVVGTITADILAPAPPPVPPLPPFQSNTLNVTAVTGLVSETCLLVGASIPDGTYINAQLTGTPHGVGTYALSNFFDVAVPSETMTIIDQTDYLFNAGLKPGGRLNIGLTAINGTTALNYGFDPQTEQYGFFQWNVMGFSTTASLREGITALTGDYELSDPQSSWADPSVFSTVYVGQRRGSIGQMNSYMGILTITKTEWTAAQLAAWTAQAYP